MSWFVLSPVGTSLLTNVSEPPERALVSRHSNARLREDVPAEDRAALEGLIRRAGDALGRAGEAEAARLSAELNGLTALYRAEAGVSRAGHLHHLLATDTWLGETTAELVATWLRAWGVAATADRRANVQTADLDLFQSGLSGVAGWASDTLPGYRADGYRVVFNLTGGFKSVQGFLQTLATFHADEVVYIFVTGGRLLRIPRLPIRLDEPAALREHLTAIRRLDLGLPVGPDALAGVPGTFVERAGDILDLSPWGKIVWGEHRPRLYGERFWEPPTGRVRVESKALKALEALPADRLVQVNTRMDELARYLEEDTNPRNLNFQPVAGRKNKDTCTHEFRAWSDKDAQRFFGHYENETFVIEELAKGLH